MKVLGLCSYPLEAAATRYRLVQFIAPLAEKGISLEVFSFLNKDEFASLYKPGGVFRKIIRLLKLTGKRLFNSLNAKKFDVVLVQREAMIIGPPIFEWLYKTIGEGPMILDLDDATYLSYVSPTYGRLGSALKFFGKTDTLIDWSEMVICGNRHIAEYVESRGKKAVVVPTVVDTDKFYPIEKDARETPVLGWIGTHSTFPLLEEIFPVLQQLAREYDFILKIVGAGKSEIKLEGVRIDNLPWNLEREVADFQSLDIGLYPLEATKFVTKEWLAGKSGFKAIQYMAVGIPFVVTPIGVCAEIGIENKTHFSASTDKQWRESLVKLLESSELRKEMGEKGRKQALERYSVPQQADKIARVIQDSVISFQKTS